MRRSYEPLGFCACRCLARLRETSGNGIDLMADYDRSRKPTLFDKARFEVELADILSISVDLCDREMLEASVRVRAEQEVVLVS